MEIFKDISYSESQECKLDLYLPESKKFCVFVYFHGGALQGGDKTASEVMAEYLLKQNVAVVSANYRLYPDAKFPDFVEDAAKCVSWVFSNIGNYGQCENIFVGGSSAGAYLSMLLCFDSKYLSEYGINPLQIAGFVHDAGQPTTHFNVLYERNLDSRRVIVDEDAPIYHVGRNELYPKMMFIVSDGDMENRLEQTMLMVSTLKHFGHEKNVDLKIMKNSTHCAYVRKIDEGGNSVFGEMIYSFISNMNERKE